MIVIGFNESPSNAALWGPSNEAWEAEFQRDGDSCLNMLYNTIRCSCVDVVDIGHGIDMWVDGEALLKEDWQINHIASALRTLFWAQSKTLAVPVRYPPIMGVVVLLGEDEEGNCIDLTPEQVEYIRSLVPVKKMEGGAK